MRRRTFLAGTAATAGAAAFPASAAGDRDAATLALVTAAADRQAAAILSKPDAGGGGWGPRGVLRQMRRLTTPFVWPSSNAFHDDALLGPIETLLAKVEAAQHDDGTFSAGNRHSPPDTAFLIGDMVASICVYCAHISRSPDACQQITCKIHTFCGSCRSCTGR